MQITWDENESQGASEPRNVAPSSMCRAASQGDSRFRVWAVLAVSIALCVMGCDARDTGSSTHTIDKTRVVERPASDLQLGSTSGERFGFNAPRRTEPQRESGALTWDTPKGWDAIPSTSMRTANFRVGGDEHAECYLTLLAGDAGGVASNVNRWRAQMSLPTMTAKEIDALPRAKLFGRDATYVDFSGTWTGMSGREKAEDYRLVGMLLFSPDGSMFLKMVGPGSVIGGEVESFRKLAASFRTGDNPSASSSPHDEAVPRVESANGGLVWKAPPGWRRAPDRATRAVSFFIGEGEAAECYITLLAGDAGGPLANINRWRKQMGRNDMSADEMGKLERIPMLGSQALIVEVEGQTEASPSATSVLLGAVSSLGGRSVFVKCTGPKAQVEPQIEAFKAFCSSLSASP